MFGTNSRTAKANKRQEKPYGQRHFGRLAKLANGHLWLGIGVTRKPPTPLFAYPNPAACFGSASWPN
jgi:hypothetical protein